MGSLNEANGFPFSWRLRPQTLSQPSASKFIGSKQVQGLYGPQTGLGHGPDTDCSPFPRCIFLVGSNLLAIHLKRSRLDLETSDRVHTSMSA